ncbi:SLC13 family permease [Patulibacter sp. SYSU D01012]|uniref:SLC13 family permease n=1 Tax=Patulibacter sp. SYSU D01012 TaxID=2817381 RepID=UPI001B31012F|nr:SLC13 family permease [Patulibacter sp. SYSU D01012]
MVLATTDLAQAWDRAWPAFALVAGLLLLGLVAERGGLFAWTGDRLGRVPGPPVALAVAVFAVLAAVTAVLNLDTAVVFVTPIAIRAVRRRGLDPRPVAYAALVMVNASSLLLPGANLTNLIVQGADPIGGARWLVEVAPAGLAAAVVSGAVLLAMDRGAWRADGGAVAGEDEAHAGRPDALAVAATLLACGLILALTEPALPVLALGVVTAGLWVARGRLRAGDAVRAVGPAVLLALLALVVALGWLARRWSAPGDLVADAGPLATAAIAAATSVVVNNLPASALLTAGAPAHPEALLVGLNLGPNLFVTGSLAAWLWWRTCAAAGVDVTLRGVVARGAPAALLALPAAVLLLPS